MTAFLWFVCLILLYLLPSFCALARGVKHSTTNGITLLNLLLGWTVIGWVIALVWAATAETKTASLDGNGTMYQLGKRVRAAKEMFR